METPMALKLTLWSLNVLLIVFGILDFIPIQIPLLIGINSPQLFDVWGPFTLRFSKRKKR